MIRRALIAGTALVCAATAHAQEGGAIRSGEHADFSRLVMRVDVTTEWSLETRDGRATVFFPGKTLDFGTGDVFDLIPRTRVTGVRTEATEGGTRVEIDLGCDCRVSTTFVDGRWLAVDVADRGATGQRPDALPEPEPEIAEVETAPVETPEERAAREAGVVASAEDILLQQIERAADQGIIQLKVSQSAPPRDPGAPAMPRTLPPEPPAEPEIAATEPPEIRPEPQAAPGEDPLAGLLDHRQIVATTVFDRDRASLMGRMAETAVPVECVDDARLDVGEWSSGAPYLDQAADLARLAVGEFDTVDPVSLAAAARLKIHYGLGLEAEFLLGGFDAPVADRALLVDLARAVEGRAPAEDGPLSIAAACPGRHGLWLALAGPDPVWHGDDHFASVAVAYAELPPDLRALIGPALMDRYLEAGLTEAARKVYETVTRSATAASPEMRLSEASLVSVEGHPVEAIAAMNTLVESNAPNAAEALTRMVRLALDDQLPIPERLITDLRSAALQHRGTAREPELRALLVESLARDGALAEAMGEIDAAKADLPDSDPDFTALAADILGEADPETIGAAAYAEIMLDWMPRLDRAPAQDATRMRVAERLDALGLPRAALDTLDPAVRRGGAEARRMAAAARLKLGEPDAALAVLGDLSGAEAAELRARALARRGDFAGAAVALDVEGFAARADDYAWPSGAWPRAAEAAETPERAAMAEFMAMRADGTARPAPSDAPEALEPVAAFREPLPSLERPSLDAARRLLASGAQIEGFVQNLLENPEP